MKNQFTGLGMNLGNLSQLSNAVTRAINAENPTGNKGQGGMATEGTGAFQARELGQGWKISPSIHLKGQTTAVLADIQGPGAIQHIWIAVEPQYCWRHLILRFYWDNEETPSIEVPLGDFFCNGWCVPCPINSLPVAVNSFPGFNCYWEMPFRQHARITIENLSSEMVDFYWTITYTLTDIPEDRAYLHAQWRRSNPVKPMQVHTLLDNVHGQGQYVGTYIAWGVNHNGWWGEGEIKFYIDGDLEWPTICGTGTEDYFCGGWAFELAKGQYCIYSTPFSGLPQVIKPDGFFQSQQRFGLYRWHVMDPIRFQQDLRVTIQDLGAFQNTTDGSIARTPQHGPGRFHPRQDDIASTVFWYQAEPHAPFPLFPRLNDLEVI